MESIEQQLVYKNNEAPVLILSDSYNELKEEDYHIFNNMLMGVDEININNLIIKEMDYECFKMTASHILKQVPMNIIWRSDYIDIVKCLDEKECFFDKNVKIIIKLLELNDQKAEMFGNIKAFRTKYKNISAVILKVNIDNYDRFIEIIDDIYSELQCSIIVEPELDNENSKKISWPQLDILYCDTIEFNKKMQDNTAVLMEFGILPVRLLNEHPCNGYVCAHNTCHSNKNDLPRRLVVLRDGTIFPENSNMNHMLAIGNVSGVTLMEVISEYKDSKSHEIFKEMAKEIYIKWVQTNPFRVVPWSKLLLDEANKRGN